MKRNIDINEITDGNKYSIDSVVKISCNDCEGCDKCCHNMGESIVLDPYDICRLTIATGKSFEQLLAKEIALSVVDGIILPHINMVSENDPSCSFLVDGRCSIHDDRPGICRLFPLGRLYNDDGSFSYINQIYECDHSNKSKVKIKKWLGLPNVSSYEKYISSWHNFLKRIEEKVQSDEVALKKYNMLILNTMYVTPYGQDDFYTQYYKRIDAIYF